MNKNEQKRHSAYHLGLEDGKKNRPKRYSRHRYMKAYTTGYYRGRDIFYDSLGLTD